MSHFRTQQRERERTLEKEQHPGGKFSSDAVFVFADGTILRDRQRISHRSISSQSSSIAGDEAVLFILMVTALQQTDEEENRDGNSRREAVITATLDTGRKNTKFSL